MYKIIKIDLQDPRDDVHMGRTEYNLPQNYVVDGIISVNERYVTLIIKPDPNGETHYRVDGFGNLIDQDNNVIQFNIPQAPSVYTSTVPHSLPGTSTGPNSLSGTSTGNSISGVNTNSYGVTGRTGNRL